LTARRPVLVFSVVALMLAGPASAASPQKIYKDLADNGRLDAKYRRADITRAFNLERVIRTDQKPPVRRPAAVNPAAAAEKRSGSKLPFTGLDLALLTVGGGPLLLIALGLRRRVSRPAPEAVVGG